MAKNVEWSERGDAKWNYFPQKYPMKCLCGKKKLIIFAIFWCCVLQAQWQVQVEKILIQSSISIQLRCNCKEFCHYFLLCAVLCVHTRKRNFWPWSEREGKLRIEFYSAWNRMPWLYFCNWSTPLEIFMRIFIPFFLSSFPSMLL